MGKILVTGGAGYIGSHVVKSLVEAGESVVVVDNLSTGFRKAVIGAELVVADLGDDEILNRLFLHHQFEAVMHFAGSIVVPESVREPLRYYQNNTLNSWKLLGHCVTHKVRHFIFSSTAAVYGMPQDGVCAETAALAPLTPYGHSKLMTEQMLWDTCSVNAMSAVALRYFNVSGADAGGMIGQSFPQATHLIKVACETAVGKRPQMEIFGTGYPTPDGTCIRDYIHVTDLAAAHLSALSYLRAGGPTNVFNCGYGKGYSVREVIAKVKEISGVDFKVVESAARPGDSANLISRAEKILQQTDWRPQHEGLEKIIASALNWEKKKRY
mgnify:CR=1 FL=1